jgi:hypothetical protein
MKALLCTAGLLTALVFSCSEPSETQHGHQPETIAPVAAVTLNNGEKWQANPETTDGIKNMTALLQAIPDTATVEDYHTLRTRLEAEFNAVLRNCTMTGEAHEQLHNFLLPMKSMFDDLGSGDAATARRAVHRLEQHTAEYYRYFR